MIRYLLFYMTLFLGSALYACDVCQKNQPEITKGITHGAGPESSFDWYAVVTMCVITLATLIYFIKYLVKPESRHTYAIKNQILQHEP